MGTKAEPRYRDVDILTFRGTIAVDVHWEVTQMVTGS